MRYRGSRRADTLVGTDADDTFLPLRGHDTVDGGGGYDTLVVDYTGTVGRTGVSRIFIADDMTLQGRLSGGDKDSVDFRNIEAVDYKGSAGDDTLSVTSERPLYFGMLTLDGGAGHDRLEFTSTSAGDKTFFIDTGSHLTWDAATVTGFEAYELHLGGGADLAYAHDGDDVLYGDAGDDDLSGGGGGDLLNGGVGADVMTGGEGADVIQFSALADFRSDDGEIDTILFFEHGSDRIDLSAIDAAPGVKGNQAFAFIGDAQFGGSGAGELRIAGFDDTNGWRYYTIEGDVNRDGVADFAFRIDSPTVPVAEDFIL